MVIIPNQFRTSPLPADPADEPPRRYWVLVALDESGQIFRKLDDLERWLNRQEGELVTANFQPLQVQGQVPVAAGKSIMVTHNIFPGIAVFRMADATEKQKEEPADAPPRSTTATDTGSAAA